ncbi:acyl-CoA thioesterase [Actinokineospora sp.]|uniref:acyl-CoA thioesterase n=1 Tax=Actinokineospora sp. TaxID=1872133 RepID=UPI004037A0F2
MNDFAVDTEIVGADGRYVAQLSPAWAFWGPSGGHVATMALRAAAAHSGLPRPASLTVHFLSTAGFGEIELSVRTLRPGQRAQSVQVSITQDGKPIAEALAWLTAEGIDGIGHDVAAMPAVPSPDTLPPLEERLADCVAPPPFIKVAGFLENVEWRPIEWYDNWLTRPPGAPHWHGWYRYRTPLSYHDPLVESARTLIPLDVMGWAAAQSAHAADVGFIAPSLDLNVQFHRTDADSEWLYAAGTSHIAADGLVAFRSDLWSQSGQLLSSGSGTGLCRKLPTARE